MNTKNNIPNPNNIEQPYLYWILITYVSEEYPENGEQILERQTRRRKMESNVSLRHCAPRERLL